MRRRHPIDGSLRGTTLIEASAGTGKTYTITTLFLRLLLERRLLVSQILVVTYTNAATAELRDRIRTRIYELACAMAPDGHTTDATLNRLVADSRERNKLEPDRRWLLEALRGFDEAAISTIHGFCQRMLQENAFESGVPFDTELVTDEGPLRAELANDYWAGRMYDAPEPLVRAARTKNVQRSLTPLVARAVANPTMRVLPDVAAAADIAAAEAEWRLAWQTAAQLWRADREEILRRLCDGALKGTSHNAEKIRDEWAPALDEEFSPQRPEIGVRFDKLAKLTPEALSVGTKKKHATPRHAFFDACGALAEADAAVQAAVAAQMLHVRRGAVDFARAEIGRRKALDGRQSFDDLLHRLDDALGGPGGATLAEAIRRRFPAALIDEFQDTDPVQYAIFRRVYRAADSALFLIGDPRQAIYGFRGADVFAYMDAKNDAVEQTFTLSENRRSDPSLLAAVNAIFSGPRHEFVLDGIRFEPIRPPQGVRDRLAGDRAHTAPLQVLFVPRVGDVAVYQGRINKGWGDREIPAIVADDIVRLLASDTTIDGRRVEPGDVAVLCRKNTQAVAVQEALRASAVPSVLHGDASVFEAIEAAELERVLRAMADPGDGAAFRAALSTPIVGLNGNQVHALQDDEREWGRWVERVREWRAVWTTRGFMPAFRALLDELEVRGRLLELADGERRLTNLLHLGELLHDAATRGHRGPLALVAWLAQMRADRAARGEIAGEAAQIRLESDVRAVRLFTIHKSKGLEFPIVFCPFLWDGTLLRRDDEQLIRFHDPNAGHRLTLDLGSNELTEHKAAAQREALAENLRLLYVALTRARHRCTVIWGAFNDAEDSPLAYLLHQPPGITGDAAAVIERTKERVAGLNDAEIRADLAALATRSGGTILVRDYALPSARSYVPPGSPPATQLCDRSTNRMLDRCWRTSSFSALTARAPEEIGGAAAEGVDHDDRGATAPAADAAGSTVPLAEFPAGTNVGTLLHAIFEDLDFAAADPASLAARVGPLLAAFGVDAQWNAPLCDVIPEILATPLPSPFGQFTLRDVPADRRLNELRFLFPVAGDSGTPRLSPERLGDVFAHHTAPAAWPAYPEQLRRLGFAPLEGFLTGAIDLVFEHAGRWYLVDYKSNHLGARPEDYRPPSLIAEMDRHHYFLQYHLYTVAVHRYLAQCLPAYEYERHFGGVLYLFLRGMWPGHDAGTGVFVDRPPAALIEDLSALMRGAVGAE